MASATSAPIPRVTAAVARVGFDHGWLCLSPTFLNLQLPVLVVDRRLLPEPTLLGLEPFGSRDPRLPLPTSRIVVQHHPGAMISLWDHHPGDPSAQLLGWHRAATPTRDTQHASWARAGGRASRAVVIIGDTHRIQLCWAAVWDSHIGHAQLIDATQQIVSRTGTGGNLTSGSSRSP
jgi:hypothetical protein